MAPERLQKILAKAGYGSRRSSEELIIARRVTVNGEVASLGSKADAETDDIRVDGQKIPAQPEAIYIVLYKPVNVLTTNESPNDSRRTVRDLVPVRGHIFPVGRLDYDSEGLILLTNDGELTNRLTHPRYEHEKEYRVLVDRKPDEKQLAAWRHGIVLEDGYRTAPAEVSVEAGSPAKGIWMRVVLHEGRNRQIREMARLTGLLVQRIIRVRLGTLEIGQMNPGEWRNLKKTEVQALLSMTKTPKSRPPRRAYSSGRTPRRPL